MKPYIILALLFFTYFKNGLNGQETKAISDPKPRMNVLKTNLFPPQYWV